MIYMSTTQRPNWLRGRRKVVTDSTTGTTPTAAIDEEHTSDSVETIVRRFAIAGAVIGLIFGGFLIYVLTHFGFTFEVWKTQFFSYGNQLLILLAIILVVTSVLSGGFTAGRIASKKRKPKVTVTDHTSTIPSSSSH